MQQRHETGVSRRGFAQLLGFGLAGAAVAPALDALAGAPGAAPAGGPGLRLLRAAPLPGPSEVVRLSSNENPYGPSPLAFDAMREAFALAWRYPDEHAEALAADLAARHGVAPRQVLLGCGSSELLKLCAAVSTGSGKALIVAEPTFEAVVHHARTAGAQVVAVPLGPDFRHDLPRMLAAVPEPGLIYVCNPNNPTASITPKQELRAFLARVPARSTVLVDEAYFHYVESPDYESVMPLVAAHPNLIVLRTFSKIYGMAGLRCGYAVAQPEAIARLRAEQTFDSVNILAIAAASASLRDEEHLARGRRRNRETKAAVLGELERLGFRAIPSFANFMMIDLRRDAAPVRAALRAQRVEVGRSFPALPNHLRVTLGTSDQMAAFLSAFRKVTAAG